MTRFEGKVAIVTGSSSGIGRATALLFAQEGAKVTITGRNTERLEETRQHILKSGVPEDHVLSVVADLAKDEDQDKLINETIYTFGHIDILVNNAGTAFVDAHGRVGLDQDVSDYDKVMQINLRSVVTLTQKAKEHLIKTRGEIVNVSSVAGGQQAMPDMLYYAMSKSALDQFTRSTSIALIAHGVRVNSVSPGAVITGIDEAMGMPAGSFEKMAKFWESKKECLPNGRVGQPDDIANIIAFLADRKLSSYIIGQTIVADGGSSLVMGMHAHDMMEILKQQQ
ncbi:unnamed protein product [Caenorhabditis nigoni]|uniref:Uncharacterized protein n=1 Tax=Caenorhabditis nigoni TaxID=1611254 RepID=A0A2G5TDL2_9PELO|nr:hypothetical protein B9Z55_018188 [Caenorhabditis nigoni]